MGFGPQRHTAQRLDRSPARPKRARDRFDDDAAYYERFRQLFGLDLSTG